MKHKTVKERIFECNLDELNNEFFLFFKNCRAKAYGEALADLVYVQFFQKRIIGIEKRNPFFVRNIKFK